MLRQVTPSRNSRGERRPHFFCKKSVPAKPLNNAQICRSIYKDKALYSAMQLLELVLNFTAPFVIAAQ